MNFLICGFMGAGKSTLLTQLSEIEEVKKRYQLYDLDDYILKYILKKKQKNYLSLNQLIESKGWERFRQIECEALKEILSSNVVEGENKKNCNNRIVSLGGGFLSDENSFQFVKILNLD